MVLSIEAKQQGPGKWEVYTDNGRERTGLDAVEWAKRGVERGAGEILVTSIDREGTRKGFDVALTRAIAESVPVPVIASGGYGAPEHLLEIVQHGQADAAAFADALHYGRTEIGALRAHALAAGLAVRKVSAI
jgi:imidazole glycerol-phosphate synthase subunit HisF